MWSLYPPQLRINIISIGKKTFKGQHFNGSMPFPSHQCLGAPAFCKTKEVHQAVVAMVGCGCVDWKTQNVKFLGGRLLFVDSYLK